jgi:hypothetical protein
MMSFPEPLVSFFSTGFPTVKVGDFDFSVCKCFLSVINSFLISSLAIPDFFRFALFSVGSQAKNAALASPIQARTLILFRRYTGKMRRWQAARKSAPTTFHCVLDKLDESRHAETGGALLHFYRSAG